MASNIVEGGVVALSFLVDYSAVIGPLVLIVLWICHIGVRAIIGEYFKQWFFHGPLRRASLKAAELAKTEQELQQREKAIENARAQLEGRILRRWFDDEARFRRMQTMEQGQPKEVPPTFPTPKPAKKIDGDEPETPKAA